MFYVILSWVVSSFIVYFLFVYLIYNNRKFKKVELNEVVIIFPAFLWPVWVPIFIIYKIVKCFMIIFLNIVGFIFEKIDRLEERKNEL